MRMSVREAAKYAGVCEGIVRQWVAAGLFPHYRLGAPGKRGRIVIDVEDLDALLDSFKVREKEPAPNPAPAPSGSAFRHLKFN